MRCGIDVTINSYLYLQGQAAISVGIFRSNFMTIVVILRNLKSYYHTFVPHIFWFRYVLLSRKCSKKSNRMFNKEVGSIWTSEQLDLNWSFVRNNLVCHHLLLFWFILCGRLQGQVSTSMKPCLKVSCAIAHVLFMHE